MSSKISQGNLKRQSDNILGRFLDTASKIKISPESITHATIIGMVPGALLYSAGVTVGIADSMEALNNLGPVAAKAVTDAFLAPGTQKLMGDFMAGNFQSTAHAIMGAGAWTSSLGTAIAVTLRIFADSVESPKPEPERLRGATRISADQLVKQCHDAAAHHASATLEPTSQAAKLKAR